MNSLNSPLASHLIVHICTVMDFSTAFIVNDGNLHVKQLQTKIKSDFVEGVLQHDKMKSGLVETLTVVVGAER